MKRYRSPEAMHRSGVADWAWATAVPPMMNTVSVHSISGANYVD